jgi:biotin-dependent carboxylase-like uncharacterized protein
MSLRVLKPGLLTTVQDAGRFGHAAIGVGNAGAANAVALRLGNALVGNAPDAAALEFTLIGPRLHFSAATCVALIGDAAASIDGKALAAWRRTVIPAGATLDCGSLRHGARGYLAVRGGLQVPQILGSRSTDVNAGIGRPLVAGDELALGETGASTGDATWSLDPRPWFDFEGQHPIRLIPGSHYDHLDADSRSALFEREFRVSSDSNRVGWRLDGVPLRLSAPLELISTGVVPGTMQLPPGGQPIVLGVEGPTSGGYPRIAHVVTVDLAVLAQRRPGDGIRFALTTPDAAVRSLRERDTALQRLEAAIHARRQA